MSELPSGTVSLLFSDIEGSTVLLSRLGPAYAEALDAQRHVLREAWRDHGGTELGTEGDSFFVVFPTAEGAVAAAAQAQRRLAGYPWPAGEQVRVRMGIHTGTPTVHGEGYVGMDVHRAARIAGAAHGGQVVLSQATAHLVDGCLPDATVLRDLGSHQLKDIASPERLFQLSVGDLPSDFPPLKTLGASSSLPRPATPLVGRAGEVAELAALLSSPEVRLVTLTGPGGSGKTRLAIGVAERLVQRFPDGVYFVPLATVTTSDVMWTGIAEVLDVPPEARIPPGLLSHVAHRSALFVLDNLEQISGADQVVSQLLTAATQIVVIATTRRPLHVAAEHEHPVPPLELPEGVSLVEAEGSGAVRLFVQHARKVRPSFSLTPDNAADVAEVCRRLDGLPLAIELVAARSKLLTPPALLARLDHALDITTSSRQAETRQKTLRDTLDWSYQLLSPEQQAFFRRLGVFASGADLDAVAAVTQDLLATSGDPLDLVAELLDASLLTVTDTGEGEPRVFLLETVRAYTLHQLRACAELEAAQAVHAAHYVALASQLVEQLNGPHYLQARSAIDLELNNLRAALSWTLGRLPPEPPTATQLAASLQATFDVTRILGTAGHYSESRRLLEQAVELAGDTESPELARCLAGLADITLFQDTADRAVATATRAADLGRRMNDPQALIYALNTSALCHFDLSQHSLARQELQEAVALAHDHGRHWQHIICLINLADMESINGDLQRALELLTNARAIAHAQGDLVHAVFADVFMAELRWRLNKTVAARNHILDLTDEVLELRDPMVTIMHAELCSAALAEASSEQAARLLGAADAERERTGLQLAPAEKERLDSDIDLGKQRIGGQWSHHYTLGRAMTLEDALNETANNPLARS